MMRLATPLLALLLAAPAALAQSNACDPGTASADLALADVRARLFNKGNLFFDGGDALYEVPKGSGISPLFAFNIWVGGRVGGETRVAAATYGQLGQGYELFPGPLDEAGNPPEDCTPYDRIWRVDAFDLAHDEATGEASADMAAWPVHLGAPVTDDGRPAVYGHETAFWVMNDVAGPHLATGSDPIGLEVRVTAFTNAEAMLARSTVYRYELVYRGEAPLEDARFTLWADPDLGAHDDDYIGSDTTRSLAFVYNATNFDDPAEGGYGTAPPALGMTLLGGAGALGRYVGGANARTGTPNEPEDYYNYMQGLWKDGSPMTEGGDGLDATGTPTTFLFPGEIHPEPQFWSEICPAPGCASPIPPGDRRLHFSTPAFSMQPGETKVIDFAILFAQGNDHLHSVAELKALADAVQARYDEGSLFAPGIPPPPAGSLAAPQLLAPEDGTLVIDEPAELRWTAVPGAEAYRVEFATSPEFALTHVVYTEEPALSVAPSVNEVSETYWRVRATAGLERSHPSEIRSFRSYHYEFVPDPDAIVEAAHPAGDPCAEAPEDAGCQKYGGNAVWLDPNSTGDYYVSSHPVPILDEPGLAGMLQHFGSVAPDDLEMRFSEACAAEGACLGVYGSPPNPEGGSRTIASVPFELWRIGEEGETRMIPFLRANTPGQEHAHWADTFTGTQESALDPGLLLPVTEQVYWMVPNRPDGYERFHEAAAGFGGPGASYDAEADGDEPSEDCAQGGYYVDFCHAEAGFFVAPVQKMVLADLSGDGSTPPAGTTIRFIANKRLNVGAEGEAPSVPEAARLLAPYPNPFRASAAVPFEVAEAGRVRLALYDVLGRRVGVLVEGELPAGRHEARLVGRGLSGGVYLVVMEAGGERQARRVVLAR